MVLRPHACLAKCCVSWILEDSPRYRGGMHSCAICTDIGAFEDYSLFALTSQGSSRGQAMFTQTQYRVS